MVDLTKCQITMANLTNYKSQWPFNKLFGLLHNLKGLFSLMS